jgi:hypothetical protein
LSTSDEEILQKQQFLRELLQRQRDLDTQPLQQPILAQPLAAQSGAVALAPNRSAAKNYKTKLPARRKSVAQPVYQAAPARSFDTAIIDGETMDRIGVAFVRAAALILLGIGLFGSILAFDGDWQPSWTFWRGLNPWAVLAGLALQIEITIVEWWRADKPGFDLAYWAHLILDTGLMLWGWWPVVGLLVSNALYRAFGNEGSQTSFQIATAIVLAILAFLIARQPERWLVRR